MTPAPARLALAWAVSFAAALASFHFLEQPFLKLKARFTPR